MPNIYAYYIHCFSSSTLFELELPEGSEAEGFSTGPSPSGSISDTKIGSGPPEVSSFSSPTQIKHWVSDVSSSTHLPSRGKRVLAKFFAHFTTSGWSSKSWFWQLSSRPVFFSPCLLSVKSQDSMARKSVLTMSCMPLMLMPPDVMSCHPNNSWQVMSLCHTVPCHAMSSCQTVPCHHVKPCHVIMMYGHAMPQHMNANTTSCNVISGYDEGRECPHTLPGWQTLRGPKPLDEVQVLCGSLRSSNDNDMTVCFGPKVMHMIAVPNLHIRSSHSIS